MKTYEEEVDEIIDVVIKLAWNYTVFRALFEKKDADREARGAHPEFFLTMHDSLFCGFCVATALLFSEKEKSTSICSLIRHIQVPNPDLAKKLNERIRVNQGPIDELQKIRNQVCAHRWEKKTPQEVFDEVGPRMSMMREIIDLARSAICELAEVGGVKKRERLEKQQLSKETLQCIADDTGQVMRAFEKTCQLGETK
jgi:HAMP domain-containing protein